MMEDWNNGSWRVVTHYSIVPLPPPLFPSLEMLITLATRAPIRVPIKTAA